MLPDASQMLPDASRCLQMPHDDDDDDDLDDDGGDNDDDHDASMPRCLHIDCFTMMPSK